MNLEKRKMKLMKKAIDAKDNPILRARVAKQLKALKSEYADARERAYVHSLGVRG